MVKFLTLATVYRLLIKALKYLYTHNGYSANLLLLDGDRGSALCWALKAKDEDVCSRIAELEMENYHTTEEWSIPRLVDAIENNSSNIYSEKLLFLSKYKQVKLRKTN